MAHLTAFVRRLGLPTRLSELDLALDNLPWEQIAAESVRMVLAQNNPRPATVEDCLRLLEAMR